MLELPTGTLWSTVFEHSFIIHVRHAPTHTPESRTRGIVIARTKYVKHKHWSSHIVSQASVGRFFRTQGLPARSTQKICQAEDAAGPIARPLPGCPGERHGWRYFSPRQGLSPAARAVATNSAVTQLGVQMGTQIHRSTIKDWKVRLHVAIQTFNHKLFAELSSRMGAEMLPIDGAPEATCAFAVHIIHRKSDGKNSSLWRRSKLFVMEVTSWFLPSNRLGSCSTPALFEECSEHHRATPDILPIDGGTAVDTYQLQNKQTRSKDVLTEREAATEVLQEPLATRSLRIFLDTDDSALLHKSRRGRCIAASARTTCMCGVVGHRAGSTSVIWTAKMGTFIRTGSSVVSSTRSAVSSLHCPSG